ncbi:MAG: hypothetical protein K6E11_03110 [Bacilli bacterium]|nr:hypothetical protein [Bacilli bacterium]
MKKILMLLTLFPLALSGCNVTPDEQDSKTSGSSESTSQNTGTTTTPSDTTSDDPTSEDELEPDLIDLGKKTISEVKALCASHVTSTNEAGLGVNNEYKVTIEGIAIDHNDLVKTKAPYGLLPSAKTIFADETGYIACSGTALMNSATDYTKQRKSFYTLTGKLSLYMGIPELYVPSKNDYSNDKSKNLSTSLDVTSICKATKTVAELYTEFHSMPYNFSGHGYGDIFKVNNLKVLEKKESSNNYLATDGYRMIKLVSYDNLHVGTIYNMSGMISTKSWQPAFRCLGYTTVTDETIINNFPTEYKTTAVVNKTITEFKQIKSKQGESNVGQRFDSFTDSFQYVYKANAYVSYWVKSGNYQLTATDTYYSGTPTQDQETAHNSRGMVDFDNENYNGTEYTISHSPLYAYATENVKVDIYFTAWQCSFINNKPIWQIFHLTETMPSE